MLQKNQQKWLGGRYMRVSTEIGLANYSSYIYFETTNDIPNLSDSSAGALELPQNTQLDTIITAMSMPCSTCQPSHSQSRNWRVIASLP